MTEDSLRCKYLRGYPVEISVDQQFRLVVRLLRKQFITEYPVKVRRIPNEIMKRGGYSYKDAPWGYCSLINEHKPKNEADRYFLIRLNTRAAWQTMFETLMHEWAHALTWGIENKDHGDLFARAYGSIYRALIED